MVCRYYRREGMACQSDRMYHRKRKLESEKKMYITTYSKIHFTPLEPKEEQIRIQDIAHAQSLMTRANGHFPVFYSVAQHSIACGREAIARDYSDRVVFACLLHDASEAYLSDITRPVKSVLEGYCKIEQQLQEAIYKKFLGSLPADVEYNQIKNVDDTCLYYEFKHFMGEELCEEVPQKYSEMDFRTRTFQEVEEEFTALLETYWKKTGK